MSSFLWHSDSNLKTIASYFDCACCAFHATSVFVSSFLVPCILLLFCLYMLVRIV